MLLSLLREICARKKNAHTLAREPEYAGLAPGWHQFRDWRDAQTLADVAVIMPTVGRETLVQAIASIYAQIQVPRIQLLIGVDAPLGDFHAPWRLLQDAPAHVSIALFYPGYSTSVRHGGLHPARDGGTLRCVLTALAQARLVAYLDDDNTWSPLHLRSLIDAVAGKRWAFSRRWIVHETSRALVCPDMWESVGLELGLYAEKSGKGWVDPNSLIIDKIACDQVLYWWNCPTPGDEKAMSADRQVFAYLRYDCGPPGETGLATTYYTIQANDQVHDLRVLCMGAQRYGAAEQARGCNLALESPVSVTYILPPGLGRAQLHSLVESYRDTLDREVWGQIELIWIDSSEETLPLPAAWPVRVVKVAGNAPLGDALQAAVEASTGHLLAFFLGGWPRLPPVWPDELDRFFAAADDGLLGLRYTLPQPAADDALCFVLPRKACQVAGVALCTGWRSVAQIHAHWSAAFRLLREAGHGRDFELPLACPWQGFEPSPPLQRAPEGAAALSAQPGAQSLAALWQAHIAQAAQARRWVPKIVDGGMMIG
jgi:hypothetical protein